MVDIQSAVEKKARVSLPSFSQGVTMRWGKVSTIFQSDQGGVCRSFTHSGATYLGKDPVLDIDTCHIQDSTLLKEFKYDYFRCMLQSFLMDVIYTFLFTCLWIAAFFSKPFRFIMDNG